MKWLALDIGGANIKTADGDGYAQSYAFAMWRDSARLAQQIRTSIYEAPPSDHLAVTMTGELVYTGVERSPVCAVAGLVPYRGQSCPIVHEVFATMRDVYVVLDKLTPDPSIVDTPDGKPATKAAARTRLARMIAADANDFNHRDAVV